VAITNWKVEGTYFESCNCENVCPCIFLKDPTAGFCEAIVGWNIENGHLEVVDLILLTLMFLKAVVMPHWP